VFWGGFFEKELCCAKGQWPRIFALKNGLKLLVFKRASCGELECGRFDGDELP
jgi:hypothetical protein